MCTILYDSQPFKEAEKQRLSEEQIWFQLVRPLGVKENELGLVEVHFLFGDFRTSDRGSVVLVPSKGL